MTDTYKYPPIVKVTIISETPRERVTQTFEKVYRLEQSIEPPDRELYEDDVFVRNNIPSEFALRFTPLANRNGSFVTIQRESLDPIPDDIANLVNSVTEHNVNPHKRQKLIESLIELVNNDRKENTK